MKIAVFSDVHGNYLNLISFYESALKLGVDEFICLGDLCNYYPDNKKVIDFIIEKKITCILGNHDEIYSKGIPLTIQKKIDYRFDEDLLNSQDHTAFLKTLPLTIQKKYVDLNLCFCHAAPTDYLYTYIYPDTELDQFMDNDFDVIFFGHTHRQFFKTYKNKTFCNVGSVGLPRDNGSMMGFATFDTTTKQIELYRKKSNKTDTLKLYSSHINDDVIAVLNREEELNYKYTLIND